MKSQINKFFHRFGVDVRGYPQRQVRNRMLLLKTFGIQTVLDVGANVGQYATEIRANGYGGMIHSFEPLSQAYQQLAGKAAADTQWTAHHFALGDSAKSLSINIANNSASSSFLPMHHDHTSAAPEVSYVNQETVRVQTLDETWTSLNVAHAPVYLKVDTQGFEHAVLQGGTRALKQHITGVQLEMSLTELYEGEMLYHEMISYLAGFGFRLYSVEPGLSNHQTGELLQMDGIFYKPA